MEYGENGFIKYFLHKRGYRPELYFGIYRYFTLLGIGVYSFFRFYIIISILTLFQKISMEVFGNHLEYFFHTEHSL